MESSAKKLKSTFRIEVTGDSSARDSVMTQLKKVKSEMGYGSTTLSALQEVLTFWLEKHSTATGTCDTSSATSATTARSIYHQLLSREQAEKETLYITGHEALHDLIAITAHHSRTCAGNYTLNATDRTVRGFWNQIRLSCSSELCSHDKRWNTSSYIPGGESHVNKKMTHAFFASGVLPSQFDSLMSAAKISVSSRFSLTVSQKGEYHKIVREIAEASMHKAMTEESENFSRPIHILTDARHGWRKNARQTDVVCMGGKHHKVIALETVTSKDDPVAQRHEKIGTIRLYDQLESLELCIETHCHDNNASINM